MVTEDTLAQLTTLLAVTVLVPAVVVGVWAYIMGWL